eukprot:TRINITY_DN55681_c0_g1_i1.p1 TRINITY_DN55681_c0_g1~~TRINITY_DN55681_c0_g1_i1.p1  ORF type:complete len:469 (-),score=72.91 TRINITY_DN55681_c0_g1_i1:77-1483(-)
MAALCSMVRRCRCRGGGHTWRGLLSGLVAGERRQRPHNLVPVIGDRCGIVELGIPSSSWLGARSVHGGPSAGARIRRRDNSLAVLEEVRQAFETAQRSEGTPQEIHVRAVEAVRELTSCPEKSEAVEDALHVILRGYSGGEALRGIAEVALWDWWTRTGDDELDTDMRRGTALLEIDEFEGAVSIFSDIIERVPSFAEGWNKRATALFMLGQYEASIADCREVLRLKPRHFGCLAGMGMCYQAAGKRQEALESFRHALDVHPGLEGPRRFVKTLEMQERINERLRPQLVRVTRALEQRGVSSSNATFPAPLESPGGVVCDWDMHRVMPAEETRLTYLLRVRIRNSLTLGSGELQSLANFYSLRFSCGSIFPLTRLTEGSTGFRLKPSEEHRFFVRLAVRRELRDAAGGLLLESRLGEEDGDNAFLSADLQPCAPVDASLDEAERLQLGYHDLGMLNLENLQLRATPGE